MSAAYLQREDLVIANFSTFPPMHCEKDFCAIKISTAKADLYACPKAVSGRQNALVPLVSPRPPAFGLQNHSEGGKVDRNEGR